MPVANTAASDARSGTWRESARSFYRQRLGHPFLFVLPSLLLLALVIAYPVISAVYLSMTNGTLIKPGAFVGFDNYLRLLRSPDFLRALQFSAIFAIANVVGCYTIGLALAVLMHQKMPARGLLRVLLLLPWIIPSVVATVGWRWMVGSETALINQLLQAVGVDPIYFLSEDHWAIATVIAIKIWRSVPFMMLSLLAALQSIDKSLYEAASIDGATKWQSFVFVTLPQLRGVSVVLCLLMMIWTVNDFDTPWLLTQGGPANSTQNLVVLSYLYTFNRSNVGMGAATALVTLIILMILVFASLRQQRRSES